MNTVHSEVLNPTNRTQGIDFDIPFVNQLINRVYSKFNYRSISGKCVSKQPEKGLTFRFLSTND